MTDMAEFLLSRSYSRPPAEFSRKLKKMVALLFSLAPRLENCEAADPIILNGESLLAAIVVEDDPRFSIMNECHPCLAMNLRLKLC